MPSPQQTQAEQVKVGQVYEMEEGDVVEVVALDPPLGARVRHISGDQEGQEFNYTFASFSDWTLMPLKRTHNMETCRTPDCTACVQEWQDSFPGKDTDEDGGAHA